MRQRMAGKVAVVTGASKGIGAAIALQLAAEGASVVVNYASSREEAEKLVNKICDTGGHAYAIQADMSQKPAVKQLFLATIATFGKVDCLINNAGTYQFAPIEQVDADHFYKMINLNVLGIIWATQAFSEHFKGDSGSIVNISSIASTAAIDNASVYCASKAAVDAITRCTAKELAARHIRVNAINPGMVETEGLHASGIYDSEFRSQMLSQIPLGRLGQPADIALAAAFLASDEAAWITAETLFISGGFR